MSLWIDPDIAEIVAGLDGVHDEVMKVAHKGAGLLRAAIRSKTGAMAASVESSALGSKDAWFGMSDEGAIGYNFGHHNTWADRPVSGSHVIEEAVKRL
ncbi:DUF5403 family protein [Nonomuraea sp. NPDC050556]|uniref:DUF5403 family protein n=1 Tax=Nonomuraea sp. NPDC050556 TaxID=3364369 RepID=UPI0037B156B6